MLEDYEKGFTMENLDQFFGIIKAELVPFLRKIREEGRRIDDSFLAGDYPNDRQEKLARFLASMWVLTLREAFWLSAPIRLQQICTIRMYALPPTIPDEWTAPCFL